MPTAAGQRSKRLPAAAAMEWVEEWLERRERAEEAERRAMERERRAREAEADLMEGFRLYNFLRREIGEEARALEAWRLELAVATANLERDRRLVRAWLEYIVRRMTWSAFRAGWDAAMAWLQRCRWGSPQEEAWLASGGRHGRGRGGRGLAA